MVMEKPSAQLVGREFVRQYYTLLNQAPDYLHRFYGKNSSYVHGGLDNNGKPVEAVYGQSEIHKIVLALNFRDCHTKIRHVDAHATLNEGVVVQVMGELSNDMQPMRKFMQTFVLAPEGTVANKFYVHNDVFRYQDEVFGDSDSEPPEESDEDVEEMEERVPSPEVNQEEAAAFYEQTPCTEPEGLVEEEVAVTPEPEAEAEPDPDVVDGKPVLEPETQEQHTTEEQADKCPVSSPLPSATADPAPAPAAEDNRPFSWASVTSKNLPPSGAVPVSGIPPHVVKVPLAPPRVEVKTEAAAQRTQPRGDQRPREARPGPPPVNRGPRPGVREGEQGETSEVRRVVRYPDAHQLFVGNVPHDVDKCFNEMDLGDIRLNVEEKKTRSAREGDRRDIRPRGPGGPGGPRERIGGPRGPPTRGGMTQKPSFGSGRGTGPSEGGRYMGPRQ
uniref:GTPase activating protein (SH3 domain) binding protein 1 n=1 Tax=Oncorhynchus kisutch TaxID=8019 RepID=A0A8C7H140_ONCKI